MQGITIGYYIWIFDILQVDLVADDSASGKCTVLLTGYVRARGLSINQLVSIGFNMIHLDIGNILHLTLHMAVLGSHFRCWRFSIIED